MRILFLDFDGVIFTLGGCIHARLQAGKESMPRWELDPVSISLLCRLVLDHDLQIVVSSTWRIGTPLEELKEILGPILGPRVIGITPCFRGREFDTERGHEIQAWLNKNFYRGIEDFLILDDDSDMAHLMGHLLKTDSYNGFQAKDWCEADRYFKMTDVQKATYRTGKLIKYNVSRTYFRTRFNIEYGLRSIKRKLTLKK